MANKFNIVIQVPLNFDKFLKKHPRMLYAENIIKDLSQKVYGE